MPNIKIDVKHDINHMNYCPKCGSQLPLGTEKFCPNCGKELSIPKSHDFEIICPDCNTIITSANEDCPICGCPSNMFIQRAKNKFVRGEMLECPDCGKVFHEIIPADCPNCGCPSDKFKQYKERKIFKNSSTQNKSVFSAVILVMSIAGIMGIIGYFIYYKIQTKAEQARQEQYAQEKAKIAEAERREAEEERRAKEQIERENKQALSKFTGTYTSKGLIPTNSASGYGRFCITFNRNMTFDLRCVDVYTGYVIDRQTGSYTFFYELGGQLLDNRGNRINYYTIASLGYSINIGDYYLTK